MEFKYFARTLAIIFAISLFLFIGCQKSVDTDSNSINGIEQLDSINNVLPSMIKEFDNGTVALGFMQTARPFILNINESYSKVNIKLLEEARRDMNLVTIRFYKGTNSVISVTLTSNSISENFKKTFGRMRSLSKASAENTSVILKSTRKNLTTALFLDDIIPSEATLVSLFNQMNDPQIAFNFAADGCYARAHKMRQILNDAGYECEKLFAFGGFSYCKCFERMLRSMDIPRCSIGSV